MDELIIADILSICNNEGQNVGHWMSLARQYINLFSDSFYVTIAGGPIYKKRFSDNLLLLLPYNVEERNKHIEKLRRFVVNASFLFKNTRNKIVVLQYGSPFSTHIAALLGFRKCRLFLIEYSAVGIDNYLKKIVFKLLKPHIAGIICPSEQIGKSFGVPYCVVPDYIYRGGAIETVIPYGEKNIDFCILGRISPEKGIVEVAKQLTHTSYSVIIAGLPENDDIKEELEEICSHSSNIVLKLEYLTDSDYELILKQSKYAFLNYRGEYASRSSGVVYDTIFRGVPVIGTKCMALKFVEDNNVGFLYDNLAKLDLNDFMNENRYNSYVKNIEIYRNTHKKYELKLKQFIKGHG